MLAGSLNPDNVVEHKVEFLELTVLFWLTWKENWADPVLSL